MLLGLKTVSKLCQQADSVECTDGAYFQVGKYEFRFLARSELFQAPGIFLH